jgi:hypothetical protein
MYRNPACDMNGAIEELRDGAVYGCVWFVCLCVENKVRF